jgi:hypothetical protein
MDKGHTKISFEDEDFEAIEQAVLETERGRWFLAEYAARNRRSETTTLLASIAKLEKAVASELHHNTFSTASKPYHTLASDLETLIGAMALPNHDLKDPIEGLAADISSNAFALAGLADKIRDQIDGLAIVGIPAEPVLSMTQSINQIISLSARQSQLGRQVEAVAKIVSFCRDRLMSASTSEENSEPHERDAPPVVASLNALRNSVFALSEPK